MIARVEIDQSLKILTLGSSLKFYNHTTSIIVLKIFERKNLKKQIIVYPQDLTHIPVDLTNT